MYAQTKANKQTNKGRGTLMNGQKNETYKETSAWINELNNTENKQISVQNESCRQ